MNQTAVIRVNAGHSETREIGKARVKADGVASFVFVILCVHDDGESNG